MNKHPLAEVFGFPVSNTSAEAERYRNNRLCPFGNKEPNCTKDKAKNPLGVCSVFDGKEVAITCPIRFREHWVIAEDAANFMFPADSNWTTLTEVRLNDKHGNSAGNIDVVLVEYDGKGHVIDFGALEVQAVYISGNIRNPFEHFMENPRENKDMDWTGQPNYPRPDYLSSSRKRLAPQLIFKGGILREWGKKMAVALNKGFFETLPDLNQVTAEEADIAWMIYDLNFKKDLNRYVLSRTEVIYTKFNESLERITRPEAGDVKAFVERLQEKINDKLDTGHESETESIEPPF